MFCNVLLIDAMQSALIHIALIHIALIHIALIHIALSGEDD
jgi:hypothetical protein